MPEAGSVVWNELMTRDAARAKSHYGAVAGWSFKDMDMPDGPYTMAMSGETPHAGIFQMGEGFDGVPDHWMAYVEVADLDAAVSAAADGGEVLRPPFEVPGIGRIAILRDPGGAPYGIMVSAEQ